MDNIDDYRDVLRISSEMRPNITRLKSLTSNIKTQLLLEEIITRLDVLAGLAENEINRLEG